MISPAVRKYYVRINILRLQLSFLTREWMNFPDNARQCACLSANHMLPAGGLNLKRPPCRGRPGRRMGCGQENRIACASAAGLHRNPLRTQSSQNHQPAPQTRRTGSVARGSTLRALHGRTAERPAQSCHGGTRAARRPRRPLMMPPQPPPLRSVRLYAGQVSWKCWDMAVDEWGAAGARACRLSARPWLPGLGPEKWNYT